MGANAQTSVPAFTAGQVLTAAQMTQVNTGIPVFASSTERDAAFGGTGEKTLAEGQMAYLEDTNATQYYDGSSWAAIAGGKILQVVSTFINGTFSTSSTSFVDITGHTATITPSSASNKVLVLYTTHVGPAAGRVSPLNLVRDGSTIAQPTGSPTYPGTAQTYATGEIFNVNFNYLDSPASATAVVYKIQTKTDAGTNYINRNVSGVIAATSSLTLLEVSA